MPNETFNNLDSKKKEMFLKCSYSEFGKLSYEKVSVFQISKLANISRASFYSYFKDKEDLYFYLISSFLKPFTSSITNVDFFGTAQNLFEFLCSFYNTEYHNFVAMLLQNMNPKNQNFFTNHLNIYNCLHNLNTSNINLKNEDDIYIISFMVLSNLSNCIVKYFDNQINLDEAHSIFNRVLNIIKYGICEE